MLTIIRPGDHSSCCSISVRYRRLDRMMLLMVRRSMILMACRTSCSKRAFVSGVSWSSRSFLRLCLTADQSVSYTNI